MIQIWALRYRQSGSDRLEKQPTDLRRRHHYMRDGALGLSGDESLILSGGDKSARCTNCDAKSGTLACVERGK